MQIFGNSMLLALVVPFIAGIIASLVTPASLVTKAGALKKLEEKRKFEYASQPCMESNK
ncbi:hypothetical protein LG289_12960 [Planococcus rifietoensis]